MLGLARPSLTRRPPLPLPQILFDTWRTSTHAAIRRNCALVIANLYGDCDPGRPWAAALRAPAAAASAAEPAEPADVTLDMPHDDLLLPVLGLCAPDGTQAELAVCASSLVRRR